ncbi:hypothetical protein BT93_K0995 [Corymbia citriodora subsp. variegata]|nr:hypothetical protein BT93_K0995 [Corymbia citriodora subsp. variegata]
MDDIAQEASVREQSTHLFSCSSSLVPPHLLTSCRGIVSKLFVGGLSFYTTDKILAEGFSQFGQVVEAKVVIDRVSDRSKGFGFVTFASEDEAYRAVTEMNGKTLNGRIIFVDYAKPRLGERLGMPIARGPPELKVDVIDNSCEDTDETHIAGSIGSSTK